MHHLVVGHHPGSSLASGRLITVALGVEFPYESVVFPILRPCVVSIVDHHHRDAKLLGQPYLGMVQPGHLGVEVLLFRRLRVAELPGMKLDIEGLTEHAEQRGIDFPTTAFVTLLHAASEFCQHAAV